MFDSISKKFVVSLSCSVLLIVPMAAASANEDFTNDTTELMELETQKKENEQKLSEFSEELDKKNAELREKEENLETERRAISKIKEELDEVSVGVSTILKEIDEQAIQMEKLYEERFVLEGELNKRDDIIRERVRKLQVKQDVFWFLDIIFNSANLADLVSRYSAISKLLEADNQLLLAQHLAYQEHAKLTNSINQRMKEQRVNNMLLQKTEFELTDDRNEREKSYFDGVDEKEFLSLEKDKVASSYSAALQKNNDLEQAILTIQNRQIQETVRQQELDAQIATETDREKEVSTPAIEQPQSPIVSSDNAATLPTSACSTTLNKNVYLSQFNSVGVLSGKGQAIIDIAYEYNIDPVLMAAITFHETGFGMSNAIRNYNNPGGIMNPATNWSTLIRFDSLEDGLRFTAKTINKLIYKRGLVSITELGRIYAPVGAANDPTGLNNHWGNNVTKIANDLGGLTAFCSS